MSYVIYHTESTYYMSGMKTGGYKSKGAATAALNREAKKTALELEIATDFEKFYARFGDYDGALLAAKKKHGLGRAWCIPTNTFLAKRDLIEKADYAIADAADFRDNIEKMVTRVNLMSKKEYEDRTNTPYYMRLDRETYWSR